jgi:hypothetical protein
MNSYYSHGMASGRTVHTYIQLSLWVTEYHTVKAYGAGKVQLQELLTSALGGAEWSASRPDNFSPGIHTIG